MRSSESIWLKKGRSKDKKKRLAKKKENLETRKRKSKLHVPPVVDFKLKFEIFIGNRRN